MSETRFFWVKCWALEMLGTANVAMARATDSFAYFERHGMNCISSTRSFQSARQNGARQAAGLVIWPTSIAAKASPPMTMPVDKGKVVPHRRWNVTKKSKRSQLLGEPNGGLVYSREKCGSM